MVPEQAPEVGVDSGEPRAKPLEELGEIERGAGPSHELVWLDGVGVRRKRCHDSRPSCRLELGVRARDAGSDELSASREAPTVAGVATTLKLASGLGDACAKVTSLQRPRAAGLRGQVSHAVRTYTNTNVTSSSAGFVRVC